jgi:hypothetical protein
MYSFSSLITPFYLYLNSPEFSFGMWPRQQDAVCDPWFVLQFTTLSISRLHSFDW